MKRTVQIVLGVCAWVVVVLFAVAAKDCNDSTPLAQETVQHVITRIGYGKDYKTGICFGVIQSVTDKGWQVAALTTVPCERIAEFR